MIATIVMLATITGGPEHDRCIEVLTKALAQSLDKMQAAQGCETLSVEAIAAEDVQFFIQGKESMLGQLVDYLEKQGKLDAVLERVRKRSAYVSADGYGGLRWGQPETAIRKAYPKAKTKEGKLRVTGSVADFPAETTFNLHAGKLTQVVVRFLAKHGPTAAEGFVRDFRQVEELLAIKYGAAEVQSDEQAPVDEMYEDVGGTGRAIRAGRTSLVSLRTANKTEISHHLVGQDGEVYHLIVYASTELAELVEATEKARALSDL